MEHVRREDRWFTALSRLMDVGILLLGRERTLDYANAIAGTLLGYGSVEELTQHWMELERLLAPALERACERTDAATPLELELVSASVTRRLRFEIYRLEEDECEGFLVLVRDRDMQDALEQELALAIQMRGLTHFYMQVVHDLKAPLNAMVINLELLRDTIRGGEAAADPVYTRQKRYIDVLGEEVYRLNRSLTSLLAQTPRLAEAPKRFDLRDLMQEIVLLLEPQARSQQVAVEADLGTEALPLISRRDRLKQALLNVAVNALEAMPQTGVLGIRVTKEAGHAHVAISDSGPGIPPEILDRIYQMHFTTKTGGTGIGLYVARSVVEAHKGEIRVATDPTDGTTVHIRLPLATVPD
jgi:signal transduction histidine kinase